MKEKCKKGKERRIEIYSGKSALKIYRFGSFVSLAINERKMNKLQKNENRKLNG